MILGKPHAGWCELTSGSKKINVSYTTYRFLDTLLNAIENMLDGEYVRPQSLVLDCEGEGEWYLTLSREGVFLMPDPIYWDEDSPTPVFSEENQWGYYCKSICNDILRNLGDWADWQMMDDGLDQTEIDWKKENCEYARSIKARIDQILTALAEKH